MQYKEVAPHINFEEFEKVIRSRRSVRVYNGEKVPPAVVEKCLQMGLLAPNSSNLQPWGFYWIQSAETKQKIVEACFSQPAAKTADTLIVCVARPGLWKANCKRMRDHLEKNGAPPSAHMYYKKIAPTMYTQGFLGEIGLLKKIIFFFGGFFKPMPRHPVSHAGMQEWAVKSTALACENIMLAFRASGFDSCPMEGFDEARVKSILNLKFRDKVVMIISAGQRAENGIFSPTIRFDQNLFIHRV